MQFLPCLPFWGRRARNFMTGLARKEREGKERKGINQSINQSIIQFLPRLPFWERRARNFMTGLTRKEREGRERKRKERKREEKKRKERKGKESINQSVIQFLPCLPFWGRRGVFFQKRKARQKLHDWTD